MMKVSIEPLFLPQFRILGLLVLLFGVPGIFILPLFWLFKLPLWLAVIVVGLFLLEGRQVFELNKENKFYRESISILGIISFGKRIPYFQIKKIYLKESRESQTMWMGPIQNTVRNMVYKAYIKFSEEEKILIGCGKDKPTMLNTIQQYGKDLGAEVYDYTTQI